MKKIIPKKSLGQHFLASPSALSKIVSAGDIQADDIVVEVGPGKGVLTEALLKVAGKVIAIEKDRGLVAHLKERFSTEIASGKLDLIEGDILEFKPELLAFYSKELSYKVIANIPYYITNAIIRLFLETKIQPEVLVLLIQKEVAERIVARDKKESILSIAVKAYGTPKIMAKVPAGAFFPPPKVDSAIILVHTISKKLFKKTTEALFFKVVRGGFAHKRKKALGNLKGIFPKKDLVSIFKEANLDTNVRSEDLTLTDWVTLSTLLS
jgi:16S rRNA (adenine1518-N6/adenine1519-N6)-dimethyltransferase